MKGKILAIIIFIGVIFVALTGIYLTPYYYYNQLIHNKFNFSWYLLEDYKKELLMANKAWSIAEDFESSKKTFWKKFHFGELIIPLPYENPFYEVAPNLIYDKNSKKTKSGLVIKKATGEVLNQITFLPIQYFPVYLTDQPIFELPVARNIIKSKTESEIWNDVFTKDISGWNIAFDEMLYHLYLLHFRSKFFNQKYIKNYKKIKNTNKYVLNLNYENKDYDAQVILHKRSKQIYSFIITTRKENKDAALVRSLLIKDIDYLNSSPSLVDILLKEFQSLSYTSQTSQEGMLFLLSAFSHSEKSKSLLEYTIGFLERGNTNQAALENLYQYYFDRYGEVYTEKSVDGLNISDILKLSRNIKLEQMREQDALINQEIIVPEVKVPTIEEQYQKLIKKTRVKKTGKNAFDLE